MNDQLDLRLGETTVGEQPIVDDLSFEEWFRSLPVTPRADVTVGDRPEPESAA